MNTAEYRQILGKLPMTEDGIFIPTAQLLEFWETVSDGEIRRKEYNSGCAVLKAALGVISLATPEQLKVITDSLENNTISNLRDLLDIVKEGTNVKPIQNQ